MTSTLRHPATRLAAIGAALLALSQTPALAESTYGYNAAGTPGATATAKLNLQVNVPMLILLRVGSSAATVDTLNINVAPNPGIPGGVAAGALTAGNSQPSGWDGTDVSALMSANTPSVTAYTWTNAVGGGSLNGTFSTSFSTGGLSGASIDVASTPVSGGGIAHPGNNLGSFSAQTFVPNSLRSSTWTYSLTSLARASVTAGVHTAQLTYTATSL